MYSSRGGGSGRGFVVSERGDSEGRRKVGSGLVEVKKK
jgi:hypothetical protein